MKNAYRKFSQPPKLNRTLGILIQGALLTLFCLVVYQHFISPAAPKEKTEEKLSKHDLLVVLKSTQTLKKIKLNQRQQQIADFGRKLFFDTRLSSDNSVSCASCHQPEKFFTDGVKTSSTRSVLHRNTPSVVNSGYLPWLFWDGRATSLTAQVRGPLESEHEQLSNWTHLARVILQFYQSEYQEFFEPVPQTVLGMEDVLPKPSENRLSPKIAAFALRTLQDSPLQKTILKEAQTLRVQPTSIVANYIIHVRKASSNGKLETMYEDFEKLTFTQKQTLQTVVQNIGQALAYYQTSLQALNSPFDQFAQKFLDSQNDRLSFNENFQQEELEGLHIFFKKARCASCHFGSLFSDNGFHNIGVGSTSELVDFGRAGALLQLQQDAANCSKEVLSVATNHACEELKYINVDAIETLGAFRTPSLRNLAKTAPYFHNGQAANLQEVLDFYNNPPLKAPIGEVEGSLVEISLNGREKDRLIRFLLSLSSEIED